MIRGLYTSGWSMMANSKKMDVVSNNLANVNTNAFKKDTVVFESFPSLLTQRINDTRSNLNPTGKIGRMEFGSDVGEVFTYHTQGAFTKTDNNLDLALDGAPNAFFAVGVVEDGGQVREFYTRDGAFALNPYGQLVTKEGHYVLGEEGAITLDGADFTVEGDGTILQHGEVVGRLLIRSFADTGTLRKSGSNLVQRTELTEEQAFTGTVVQGSIEQSNVNIIKEMVDMISVMRSYEANQKILQAQDGTLEKAVNEVGALR